MIWAFRDLSIGAKFLLGAALLFCLTLFVGLEVRTGLIRTEEGLKDIVQVAWPEQNDAREIRRLANLTHQTLFRFVAWSSVGIKGEPIAALVDDIQNTQLKVRIGLQRYQHWPDLTDAERASVNAASEKWSTYSRTAHDVLDIGGEDPALATVMLGGAHDEFESVAQELGHLYSSIYARAGTRSASVLQRANTTQLVLIAGGAAFLILICLVCFTLYDLVLAPIASVTRAMAAVAGGATETSIPKSTRKDEIGQMVEAISQFREKIEKDKSVMAELARHDTLTGLPNRLSFREKMEVILSELENSGSGFSIMLLDLDRFKNVNDTLGHLVGDEILRRVAERLIGCIGKSDVICRLGGDEFAIITSGVYSLEDIARTADHLSCVVSAPYNVEGQLVHIGTSIGVARAPSDGSEIAQLLKRADLALYEAKNAGRNGYYVYENNLEKQSNRRRLLEIDLAAAIGFEQFELFYQPIVRAEDQALVCFEALIRWNHPVEGRVPPSEFIPIAEEMGLMGAIGNWVLHTACSEAAKWPNSISVAVNISVSQIRNGSLLPSVRRALEASGLAPHRLEIELTETLLLQNSELTIATLQALRHMGVRVSLDDFGTGFNSLNYLRCFPFDKLKIDQSFVRDESTVCDAIVRAVSELGRTLILSIVAEGVETPDQFEKVRKLGCTEVQGYHVGRPAPAAETLESLTSHSFSRSGGSEYLRIIA